MEQYFIFKDPGSACLRDMLINRLTEVFVSNAITNYLSIDGCGSELQIIQSYGGETPAHSQIELAIHAWSGMYAADRHAVLAAFYCLYADLCLENSGNRKTLIFCALLLHEFPFILACAMAYPD